MSCQFLPFRCPGIKTHEGEITADQKKAKESEFIIELPLGQIVCANYQYIHNDEVLFQDKFVFIIAFGTAQQTVKDSLLSIINKHKGDTVEVNTLAYLGKLQASPDSKIKYAQQGLELAEKINYKSGKGDCYIVFSEASLAKGNFSEAIQYELTGLAIFKEAKDVVGMASIYLLLQCGYRKFHDFKKALAYAFSAAEIAERNNVKGRLVFPGLHLAPLALAEIA